MSDAIGFVEAITGQKFKSLGIKATTNAPVADILARKKLGLKNHDTNINALVENNNPNVVLIHPQTMANLVSTNEKARLHASTKRLNCSMMSPKAYALIMEQFNRLVDAKNPIALAAKQRAEQAEQNKTRQEDEYLPYLITEQAKVQQATPQERNAVQRLIDHIVRAVKGWVVRTLSKYDTTYQMSRRVAESLTPADILYMAERMIKDIAKRGGDNNNRLLYNCLILYLFL